MTDWTVVPCQWARVVMNQATDALVAALPYDAMDALEISGDAWSWRLNVLVTDENFNEAEYLFANPDVASAVAAGRFPSGRVHFDLYGRHEGRGIRGLRTWKSYQAVHYPEFDLCHDVIQDRQFDFIVAEQVFEHLMYPYRACKNVYQMLRACGYFLSTTPFLIQRHGGDMDYTRWTERGFKYLLAECGFDPERIVTGSWGNRECAIADFNSCAERADWNLFNAKRHSLANEVDYPVVVWALAQK
jgi:SAM-dependent methyltransferase